MRALDARLPELTSQEVERLEQQPCWTVAEAARYLRVGSKVIRCRIDAGEIFVYRIGRWIRIPRARFIADLEDGRLVLPEDGGSTLAR